jgi:hypothetical protein
MILTASISILWWLNIALECATICAVSYKKLYCKYGTFVLYVSTRTARSLLLRSLVALHCGFATYFYSYWLSSLVEDVMLLAVLFELGRFVFAPWWIVPAEPKRWFVSALIGLVVLSLILPYSNLGHLGADWYLMAFFRTLARSVSFVALGVALLVIALSCHLSAPWKRRAVWIAAGLLVDVGSDLITWCAILNFSGTPREAHLYAQSLQWLPMTGGAIALMLWCGSAFVSERPMIEVTQRELEVLRRMGDVFLLGTERIRERT